MVATVDALRRDAKLFVDRDDMTLADAEARLAGKTIALAVGTDVCESATLQAALLTAANTAARWCGAVNLLLPNSDFSNKLRLPWPDSTLVAALRRAVPNLGIDERVDVTPGTSVLRFGDVRGHDDGLQVTFDGWIGAARPASMGRLAERERCPIAGVLAGGLAVSEVFLRHASVNPRCETRDVQISLWRPDLAPGASGTFGPELSFLPDAFWLLGLGHLGQAYAWSIAMLPYAAPQAVRLHLQDFDRVGRSNPHSQILTRPTDVGVRKTLVVARVLCEYGFDPAIVDRPFDESVMRLDTEPELALCGFDGQGPRHLLESAGFERIVECGLGGTYQDFDDIVVHPLPQPGRSARDLWSEIVPGTAVAERLARSRRLYRAVEQADGCGQVALAERSVAVPFVGAVASSLVLAETLRMLHDGERYASVSLQLSDPSRVSARLVEGGYRGKELPRIGHAEVGVRNG